MKIATGKVVQNLKGEAYKYDGVDLTVGHVLAEALASNDAGGKMKLFVLAKKCYGAEEVEVDEVDLGLMKKSLDTCKTYNNLILGQVLLELDNA